jgi:hypothetical protein
MHKFNPEKVEELKERYPLAIEDTYIQLDVARGIRVRPGLRSEHRFDFYDGIRLIISKEQEPNGRLVIHISGSATKNDEIQTMTDTIAHHIAEHFALLSDSMKELDIVSITEGQVLHLYLRLDN